MNVSAVLNGTERSSFKLNTSAKNVVIATFVALLILLNLAGNIIVCVCFYWFRSLRTKCNYFIISLSVADLCIALFAMPFWLILQLVDNMSTEWPNVMNDKVYLFWSCMDIFVGTASIMSLAAVSVDRQLAITSPFTYPKLVTHARVIVLIIAIWVYSIIITSVRGFASQSFLRNVYIPMMVVLSFFLPFIILFVMYAKIYFVARSQARRMGGNFAHDLKAAKTIAIVIGTFLICWGPFFLFNFSIFLYLCCIELERSHYKSIETTLQAVKWMAYLNSCLNPIIYTCLNRTYRRAFYKLFANCCGRDELDRHLSLHSSKTTKSSNLKNKNKRNNDEKNEFITKDSDSSENVMTARKNFVVEDRRCPKDSVCI